MTMRTKPPFRADHVGSLIRPQPLKEARRAFLAKKIDRTELRRVEDAAIRDVIAMQERISWITTDANMTASTGWHQVSAIVMPK